VIIMVWVDDLLLFISSNKLMQQTKSDLCTEWEVTDLGELSKIIGVKITQIKESLTILQKVYIESILECKGLSKINSVLTLLDLNIKLALVMKEIIAAPLQDFLENSNSSQTAHDPTYHFL